MLPDQVSEVVATSGDELVVIGVHFHNDSGARSPTPSPRCAKGDAGTGLRERLRRAPGNATCARPSRTSRSDGHRDHPARRIELITPVSHHVARSSTLARPQKPYVGTARSRTIGHPYERDRASPRRVRAHLARFRGQRHSGRRERARRAFDARDEGRRTRHRARIRRCRDPRLAEGARVRGYHFEVADGSLELLMRAAPKAATAPTAATSPSSRSASSRNWRESPVPTRAPPARAPWLATDAHHRAT